MVEVVVTCGNRKAISGGMGRVFPFYFCPIIFQQLVPILDSICSISFCQEYSRRSQASVEEESDDSYQHLYVFRQQCLLIVCQSRYEGVASPNPQATLLNGGNLQE